MHQDERGRGKRRRFLTSTVLFRCAHCGGGLPLQGPLREMRCPSCLEATRVDPRWLGRLLQSIAGGSKGVVSGDGEVRFEQRDHHPCAKCGGRVPLMDIPRGEASQVPCPACGELLHASPPPEWLARELPGLEYVYASVASEEAGSAVPAVHASGAAPVVMKCPSCGGALSLTSDSKRTMPCGFCQASVYLPDDLWRTLHPVEKARPWSFTFVGTLLRRA